MLINYQEIPKEITILQGRGMVKWQSFATMPEQYENITDYYFDDNLRVYKYSMENDQIHF